MYKQKKLDVDLILIDLDHTLVEHGNPTLSNFTKNTIAQAKKLGKEIVICTGRSLEDSAHYGKKLELTYHICFGGAVVYDLKADKIIHFYKFSLQELQNLIDRNFFADLNLFVNFHGIDVKTGMMKDFFWGQKNPEFKKHEMKNSHFVQIKDLKELLKFHIFKINIFAEVKTLDVFTPQLQSLTKLNVIRNYPEILEITSNNISKANGAQWLIDLLNIDYQKTLAFGDSHNDVGLFKFVRYGVVVANAVPELKKIAFAETKKHNEDGVAQGIVKWILPEKKL